MSRSASRTSTPAEQVLKQEITFPQSQSPEQRDPEDKPSFWEQIHAIPDDLWSANGEKGYRIYLYQPQGNRRGTNLATLTQPFDMDWVRENYGGGDYEASLHDPGWKIVASVRFSIEGESKRKPVQSAQSAGVPLPTTDSFQSQVLEIMRESTRRQEAMMERYFERDRTSNPAPAVAAQVDPTIMFTSLVGMVKEIMPASQPQQMGLLEMVALIEKFKGPDLLTVLTQAKASGLFPTGAPGGDLKTQIESVLEIAEKIGGGKSKSLGEAVIEKLPDILEAGGKAIDKYQQIESTRLKVAQEVRAIQQNGRAVVTPPPPGGPQANPAHPQQPGAPQVLPPSPGGVPPQQQSSGIGLEVEPLPGTQAGAAVAEMTEAQMNAVKQQVVQAIGRGMSGADIFGYLNTTAPAFLNGFVLRDGAGNVTGVVTEAQLTGYCSSDPVLKQAMGLARFKPCVRELLQEIEMFLGIDEDLEEEAGPRLN